ncbi:MAG: orotidine-5'-phosphate decarboxylase [Caldicoprobacterales bacterium]|jgi:orotidine-5'-phosphate decarboxylase|nr:orotidine-5'-phosphate decarboxylase [Clostridiales bacterium]
MRKDVIIACDFPSGREVMTFLDRFEQEKPFVKIGMELYYAEGPDIVRELKRRGHRIFLDLKLHDIPNTVKRAMQVLSSLNVDMTNLHAAGSSAMMQAAVEGLTRADGTRPVLLAVTMLTSISEDTMKKELRIDGTLSNTVIAYAKSAMASGLDGVVCSPHESPMVHESCGADFLTVTPGVRFAESARGDQARVTTPAEARRLGSDYIVVGRPITRADNPVRAYQKCMNEFVGG